MTLDDWFDAKPHCLLHGPVEDVGPCARCGAFACPRCVDGHGWCEPCQRREGLAACQRTARGVAWKLCVAPAAALLGASAAVRVNPQAAWSALPWLVPLALGLWVWRRPSPQLAWVGTVVCCALLATRAWAAWSAPGWALADVWLLAMPSVAALGGCVELSRQHRALSWLLAA